MPHPARGAFALLVLALAAGGCNKAPAESALKAAEQTLAESAGELERYVPDQYETLSRDLKEARARFDEGRYTDALRTARRIPDRVQEALAAANEKREALTAEWKEMDSRLKTTLEILEKAVAVPGAAPPRLDEGVVRTDLAAIREGWKSASDAGQGGDLKRAVATGRDVQAKAEALAAALHLDLGKARAAGATEAR
jgi:chromosome segregation ATPase